MNLADYSTGIGILAGVMGLLLLFAPGVLKKINEMSQRMIARIDTATFTYRIGFGVSLLIASLFWFSWGIILRSRGVNVRIVQACSFRSGSWHRFC